MCDLLSLMEHFCSVAKVSSDTGKWVVVNVIVVVVVLVVVAVVVVSSNYRKSSTTASVFSVLVQIQTQSRD